MWWSPWLARPPRAASAAGSVQRLSPVGPAATSSPAEELSKVRELLAKHGTIWFRDFDLMKDPAGFREFWAGDCGFTAPGGLGG